MKPIYEPRGAAKEYGDLAINIYTGCPHRCYYCFAPNVLHREKDRFHSCVSPRENIVEEVRKQIEREGITGKLIHLCFTCDPYPTGYDTTPTREIIKAIKESGNHVQILTKGDGSRDLDLLDENDWYGVAISCGDKLAEENEPGAVSPSRRIATLIMAKESGIKTWVSFEPVTDAVAVLKTIKYLYSTETEDIRKQVSVDKIKIGKLNYHHSNIDWDWFGRHVEILCKDLGANYYIKESLRKEMAKIVVVYNVDFLTHVPVRHIVTYQKYTCEEDFWNWYYKDYAPLDGDKIAVFNTQAEANEFVEKLGRGEAE